MSALDSSFRFIETLKSVNSGCKRNIFKKGSRFFTQTYREISTQYNVLKECLGTYPDLFLERLKTELPDLQSYESLIQMMAKEIGIFEAWYCSKADLIDSLFSREVIKSVIDEEVEFTYGKERKEAEDDFHEAVNDEEVWHRLARAYGSRLYGDHNEQSFTEEDWDYISGPLDDYKKHFQCSEVDLHRMYLEFEDIMKPRWKECNSKCDEISKKCHEYSSKLEKDFEVDVYAKIHTVLDSLQHAFTICNNAPKKEDGIERRTTNNRYAEYNCLQDCLLNQDVFGKVNQLVKTYSAKHGRIDGHFGYYLLKQLKVCGLINEGGCTQSHFGELLLKEYGSICSFKEGGAISDGNKVRDFELEEDLKKLFSRI